MSEEVAAIAFAGYFRRWQEIENGKQKLSDESKDLFGDMKAAGYDSKATRAVFRDKRKELNADPAEAQEQEAVYDLYMDALNRGLSKAPARPAPAHVEKIEKFGPKTLDPKLAEMVVKGVQTEAGRAALITAIDIMIDREEAETVAHDADGVVIENSPGTASEATDHSANGANAGEGHVDGSASARTPAGEDLYALTGQIEPRVDTDIVDRNASLAAREDEKAAAINSHLSASSSRQANTAGAVETPPTAPAPPPTHKDGCLDQSGCRVKFTSALCSRCASERAKARVAA